MSLRFVQIPAGEFRFGGRDNDKFVGAAERPRRTVTIEAEFELSVFPVTEADYAAFDASREPSDLPVVNVSWDDAQAFCAWLSAGQGARHRLPTEVEWEYAARAGGESIFQFGDTLTPAEACYFYDERGDRVGPGKRVPVGQYPLNDYGLGDMLGNVAEWTASAWTPTLEPAAAPDPARRVVRGGAWDYLPRLLRLSGRDALPAGTRHDNLGFRVLREKVSP